MSLQVHPSGWELTHLMLGGVLVEQHVIPLDDLRDHVASSDCWCKPFEDPDPEAPAGLWAHNSMDRRELLEEGKALRN